MITAFGAITSTHRLAPQTSIAATTEANCMAHFCPTGQPWDWHDLGLWNSEPYEAELCVCYACAQGGLKHHQESQRSGRSVPPRWLSPMLIRYQALRVREHRQWCRSPCRHD